MLLSKTKQIQTRPTPTVRKPCIRKVTALPFDINRSTEIIGHGITYFVIFYTTLNYLYYKSIQDDDDDEYKH